jgi:hypothetical protein
LCENLDDLDEPEAKASMIWIIGQYADRIENADQLLDDFLYTFLEEPYEVSHHLLVSDKMSQPFYYLGANSFINSNRQTVCPETNCWSGIGAKGIKVGNRTSG